RTEFSCPSTEALNPACHCGIRLRTKLLELFDGNAIAQRAAESNRIFELKAVRPFAGLKRDPVVPRARKSRTASDSEPAPELPADAEQRAARAEFRQFLRGV